MPLTIEETESHDYEPKSEYPCLLIKHYSNNPHFVLVLACDEMDNDKLQVVVLQDTEHPHNVGAVVEYYAKSDFERYYGTLSLKNK